MVDIVSGQRLMGKPNVGDRIAFAKYTGQVTSLLRCTVIGIEEPAKAVGTIKRFDGNICWWLQDGKPDEARYQSCFIWRFNANSRGVITFNNLVRVFS